ncbi:MAG: hypothetical protein K9N49_08915 [Candidatus Marinimicrobia bacterium]|nr:hypothetical protein [Candidatus Neomarinimicrobiota bacterium]
MAKKLGRSHQDTHRGGQRRDHGPAEAERLWREGLELLGVEEEELLGAKSTRLEKQELAWRMKKHTSVTGKWIEPGWDTRPRLPWRSTGSPATTAGPPHFFEKGSWPL